MRAVKLQFTDKKYLDGLLNDNNFSANIKYLSPIRLNDVNLVLFDPITEHNALDSEVVILSKFARAIKSLFFPNTAYNVELLNPVLNQQKGGLIHNTERIIDSTDIQITDFTFTIRQ
ncbi:MAG TPA: hypothetical protein DCG75_10380 [Bacteroidales bacterium]|nr:hypothetical protein [Bacteroidales bacterium]